MDPAPRSGEPYRARVIDTALAEALETAGAVVIEGPRASGKTMTALHVAASAAFLDDEDTSRLAAVSPSTVLSGPRPRLLDEWQTAPALWNLVRRETDRAGAPGQFLLTDSALPADDVTRHSGAGRFLRIRQRTMSWLERGDGTPQVSLRGLFGSRVVEARPAELGYEDVVQRLARSGFPAMVSLTEQRQRQLLQSYLTEMGRADVGRLAEVRHAPVVIDRLIRALARNTGTEVTFATLAADVAVVAPGIQTLTVAGYVDLLERLFLVERQPAWAPQLRSRARIRTSDRVHFADAALAAAALGASSRRLLTDPATVGQLFETAAFHDLSVMMAAGGGVVRHYRDSNGHEIDAVLELPDGEWAAVGVKLGGGQVPAGAQSLRDTIAHIDTDSVGVPAFRLVLTGTGGTFTMDDGTITAPLAALCP